MEKHVYSLDLYFELLYARKMDDEITFKMVQNDLEVILLALYISVLFVLLKWCL